MVAKGDIDDEMQFLEEQMAEYSIKRNEHNADVERKRHLEAELERLKSRMVAQEKANEAEQKVYEAKIGSIVKRHSAELRASNQRAADARKASDEVHRQSLMKISDEIRQVQGNMKLARHSTTIKLNSLDDELRPSVDVLARMQSKLTIELAKRLRKHLDKEMQRQKDLNRIELDATRRTKNKVGERISSSHEKVVALTNKDQRDMLETRMAVARALKAEWEHLQQIESKYFMKVMGIREEHEGLRLYVRAMERQAQQLREGLKRALEVRSELKQVVASELVLADELRILEWRNRAMESLLEQTSERREKLREALKEMIQEIRERRRLVSSKLLHDLNSLSAQYSHSGQNTCSQKQQLSTATSSTSAVGSGGGDVVEKN
eukprot:CAMPEP_0197530110 /NCGR_PEP_ID=MMETSP1318-20131121/30702_1 /TAXON_ID=552666 /ORGANISM="Partenskyella glossopodia, Strain RCC365" /LENGTH=378 /DNA_ID=CAMNT_0043085805 /DNA_START=150 /DNA_END=1286 /DNA_ORIENTATION=-